MYRSHGGEKVLEIKEIRCKKCRDKKVVLMGYIPHPCPECSSNNKASSQPAKAESITETTTISQPENKVDGIIVKKGRGRPKKAVSQQPSDKHMEMENEIHSCDDNMAGRGPDPRMD